MKKIEIKIADLVISISYDIKLESEILAHYEAKILSDAKRKKIHKVDCTYVVKKESQQKVSIIKDDRIIKSKIENNEFIIDLNKEIAKDLTTIYKQNIIIKADTFIKNQNILMVPAMAKEGKNEVREYLQSVGYENLGDHIVLFDENINNFDLLNTKKKQVNINKELKQSKLRAFIFPTHELEKPIEIKAITTAQVGFEIMGCHLNIQAFEGNGLKEAIRLAKNIKGIKIKLSHSQQLNGIVDELLDLMHTELVDISFLNKLMSTNGQNNKPLPSTKKVIPEATKEKQKKKMCIGMATYDDYDGVYFSVQALRMFHPEVLDDIEIIVLDNHPTGKCALELKALDSVITNYRYIPITEKTGTAIRDLLFEHANADYVLCMDCHVLVEPGAIKKLIDYFDANPKSKDLIQGPMLSDNLQTISTHFKPEWNKGMYGVWGYDTKAKDKNGEPFEIPMQGLGLFSCRKDQWPGFNPAFKGFGGEEGYIHEKIRQKGGKALCVPFLRWLHRFPRPMGVPYPISWEDRIHNYVVGFDELGLGREQVIEHFNKHVGEAATKRIIENLFNE